MTGNNIQLINDCQSELLNIKNFIDSDPFNSMVKYLVSYSVIKSCGTIEIIFKNIFYDHLIQNANQEAISYFYKNIKENSANPRTGKISSWLEQLNPQWKNSFDTLIKNSTDKGLLNSLVDLRNQLAHGNSISASINEVISSFSGGCNILYILDSIVK